MANSAVQAAGPRTEKFSVPMGRYLGYVVVGVAGIVVCLGVKSEGTGSFSLVMFCAAFALLAWVVLIRPEVTAHTNGLLLRNMLHDTFLPWASIRSCRIAQTLQVGTRDRTYHGLGISKSVRQATRERRQGRKATPVGPMTGMSPLRFVPYGESETSSGSVDVNKVKQEHVVTNEFSHAEQRIETLARERSKATAELSPKVVWDRLALGGLIATVVCGALAIVA